MTDLINFDKFIDPPQVKLPVTIQTAPEQDFFQKNSEVLYYIWDFLRRLRLNPSSVVDTNEFGGGPECFVVACSDEITPITVGTQKVTWRIPYAATLVGLRASLTLQSIGSTQFQIDIGKNGVSILTTKLTFDSNEKTTVTALTPGVVSDVSFSDDDEIRIDVLSVGETFPGTGLKVAFQFERE